MKAKELAEKYTELLVEKGEYEAFKYVLNDFMISYADLVETRHINTFEGIKSLQNELVDKWAAMVKINSDIIPGAFEEYLKMKYLWVETPSDLESNLIKIRQEKKK